jgi:hypothetical protein
MATSIITFGRRSPKVFPGRDYDLVACFDCLHDMGDPKGATAPSGRGQVKLARRM